MRVNELHVNMCVLCECPICQCPMCVVSCMLCVPILASDIAIRMSACIA